MIGRAELEAALEELNNQVAVQEHDETFDSPVPTAHDQYGIDTGELVGFALTQAHTLAAMAGYEPNERLIRLLCKAIFASVPIGIVAAERRAAGQ